MRLELFSHPITMAFLLFVASADVAAEVTTNFKGNVRGGFYGSRVHNRDGSIVEDVDLRARIRVGVHSEFSESVQGNLRFAGHYTDDETTRSFGVHEYNNARPFGNSTLDLINLQFQPNESWDITVGRMQTKFELVGVAKKSLDRNDSPNMDIDFTDGVHTVYSNGSGWKTHAILQHNPDESKAGNPIPGTTNVARRPLDYSVSDTRLTYFLGVENKNKSGPFVQRGLDVTVIPDGLLVDGTNNEFRETYTAIVGRAAMQWPLAQTGMDFLWGVELGYAPETPQKAAMMLGGTEKVDGNAWQTSFNLLNIEPNHSIGLVLAQADAGWLISPDFPANVRLTEVRYGWKIRKNLKLEARVRKRKELDSQTTAVQRRDGDDLYVRLTYKF